MALFFSRTLSIFIQSLCRDAGQRLILFIAYNLVFVAGLTCASAVAQENPSCPAQAPGKPEVAKPEAKLADSLTMQERRGIGLSHTLDLRNGPAAVLVAGTGLLRHGNVIGIVGDKVGTGLDRDGRFTVKGIVDDEVIAHRSRMDGDSDGHFEFLLRIEEPDQTSFATVLAAVEKIHKEYSGKLNDRSSLVLYIFPSEHRDKKRQKQSKPQ